MDIEKLKDEVRKIFLRLEREDILAVGLFGSLARGDYDERSDIDIFVITDEEFSLKEQDELYYNFSKLIGKFERDITVLVYDIKGLKRIPSWQTLNLVKDAHFVYDQGGMEDIFKKILQKAEEHGILYDDEEKVFKLKKAGRLIFSL